MPLFNETQRNTLRAVCDTLIPALEHAPDPHGLYCRAASDLQIAEAIEEALLIATDEANQLQIRLFLDALEFPALNRLIDGIFKPFGTMTLPERETVLRRWSQSAIPLRRKAFQAVKRLAFFFFYTVTDGHGQNPNWAGIGYGGPPPRDRQNEQPDHAAPRPIQPLTFSADTTLYTDVVIVGSGAGGGVAAGELSAAGLDVIVLEKGGYNAETEYDGLELASNQRLFENRGLCATSDLGVVLLAGSTLGGGTVVNWAVSLRTPESVVAEWEQDHGVTGFTGADYQQSMESVLTRLGVNADHSAPTPQNRVLIRGGEALGMATQTLPRNVTGCEDCGFCNMGCSFGAKQSTLKTYLQDAAHRGARIGVNVAVERVLIENGRAVGVTGMALDQTGKPIRLTVRAKAVVAAAGTLHTPALLLRSGLSNPNIGRNLHLHPTTVTYGMYDEQICGWRGAPMTHIISEFTDYRRDGYGFILECAPVHPGIAALTLPWRDGLQHKQIMARVGHLSNIITIIRDRDGGRVTIDRKGRPIYHYTLSSRDRETLARGVQESFRVHEAAGATEIAAPHSPPLTVTFDGAPRKETTLQALTEQVAQRGYRANGFALFSAHQMSSARLGGNPALGAFDPSGESFEVRNLFVADGSALPTAVGRNPMITIMSVAHRISQHIIQRVR
jgi:choline dehydrogenase-like flavoprotein